MAPPSHSASHQRIFVLSRRMALQRSRFDAAISKSYVFANLSLSSRVNRPSILCQASEGPGQSRGSGGGDKGKGKKNQSSKPDDHADKWTKHLSGASPPSSAAAAAAVTVIDTARSMQEKFCSVTSTLVSRFAIDQKGIQAKVLHVYLKGWLELQQVFCETKISDFSFASLLRRRGLRSKVPPSDSPTPTLPGALPLGVSAKIFLPPNTNIPPASMVLQDIQHLFFLGLHSKSSADDINSRKTLFALILEQVTYQSLISRSFSSTSPSSSKPSIHPLPHLPGPLFKPMCELVAEVRNTLVATGGPSANGGLAPLLKDRDSLFQQLQTGMYRMTRYMQHVPLRYGITMDGCEPSDFLMGWVLVLTGTLSAISLSSLTQEEPEAKEKALLSCIGVFKDMVVGMRNLPSECGLTSGLRVQTLSQLLSLSMTQSKDGKCEELKSYADELQGLLISSNLVENGQSLVAFDGWHRLGRYHLSLARSQPSSTPTHAEAAFESFSSALEAFDAFEEGCCDHYQELAIRQDMQAFASYWLDQSSLRHELGMTLEEVNTLRSSPQCGPILLHRDRIRCFMGLIDSISLLHADDEDNPGLHLAARVEGAVAWSCLVNPPYPPPYSQDEPPPLLPEALEFHVTSPRKAAMVHKGTHGLFKSSRTISQLCDKAQGSFESSIMSQASPPQPNNTMVSSAIDELIAIATPAEASVISVPPMRKLILRELLLTVDGSSVLSPSLRSTYYEGQFIPHEVKAAKEFTRAFAQEQRMLSNHLSPPSCLKPSPGVMSGSGGVMGSVPWQALSRQSLSLLTLWQQRPWTHVPTPYQQSWLLLASVLVNPTGEPLKGLSRFYPYPSLPPSPSPFFISSSSGSSFSLLALRDELMIDKEGRELRPPLSPHRQMCVEAAPIRSQLPRLSSLYDRPGPLIAVTGVPVTLPTLPTLQYWFQLSRHNVAAASHLLTTLAAAMDRERPVNTVLTLALQKKLLAIGNAAANAVTAYRLSPSPSPSPSSLLPPSSPIDLNKAPTAPTVTPSTTSSIRMFQDPLGLFTGASKPSSQVRTGPPSLPFPPPSSEEELATGRSILLSLCTATKAPMAPEAKVQLISLLSRFPERSLHSIEALKDMSQRCVYVAPFPSSPSSPPSLSSSSSTHPTEGMMATTVQEPTGLGVSKEIDPSTHSTVTSPVMSSPETLKPPTIQESLKLRGRRMLKRQKERLLRQQGKPELARPSLHLLTEATKIVFAQEKRRRMPQRAAEALTLLVPAIAFATNQYHPALDLSSSGSTASSSSSSSSSTLDGRPSLSSLGPAEEFLHSSLKDLLKARPWSKQPFLVLQVLSVCREHNCLTPPLFSLLADHCVESGLDQAMSSLMALLPSPPSPTSSSLHHHRHHHHHQGHIGTEGSIPPSSRLIVDSLLSSTLDSFLHPNAAPSSSAALNSLSWLCPLIGITLSRLEHLPSDLSLLSLVSCIEKEGSWDQAIASLTTGEGGDDHKQKASSSAAAAASAGKMRCMKPFESLLILSGSRVQERILCLAASPPTPALSAAEDSDSVSHEENESSHDLLSASQMVRAAALFKLIADSDPVFVARALNEAKRQAEESIESSRTREDLNRAISQATRSSMSPSKPSSSPGPISTSLSPSPPPPSSSSSSGTSSSSVNVGQGGDLTITPRETELRIYLEAEGFSPPDALTLAHNMTNGSKDNQNNTIPLPSSSSSSSSSFNTASDASSHDEDDNGVYGDNAWGPSLISSPTLLRSALIKLSKVKMDPNHGLPAVMLAAYEYGVEKFAMQLRLNNAEDRLVASKLVVAMSLCGKIAESGAMLMMVSKSHRALETLLHVLLRDKLAGHPALCDQVRWSCLMSVDAARVPPPPSSPPSPSPLLLTSIDEESGDTLLSNASCSDCSFWLNRGLLIKLLLVGGQCYNTEALSQVLETMSVDELIEAATILASSGRSADILPLLKHLTARHGVKRAAASVHLPRLINALAGQRRTRDRPTLVPDPCKPHIAAMIVAATRSTDPVTISNLTAAGKRLGIALCMAQNHYMTAIRLWGLWRVRHSVHDLGMEAMCWLLIACTEVGDLSIGPALLPFMHQILLPIASEVISDEARPVSSSISDLLPWPKGDEEPADLSSKPGPNTASHSSSTLLASDAISRSQTLPPYLDIAPGNVKVRILAAMIIILADKNFSKPKSKKLSLDHKSMPRSQVLSRVQATESITDLSSIVRQLDGAQEKDAILLGECFKSAMRIWHIVRLNFTSQLHRAASTSGAKDKSVVKTRKVGRPLSSARMADEVWKTVLLLAYLYNRIKGAQGSYSGQGFLSLQEVEASFASCVSTAAAAANLLPMGKLKVMMSTPVDIRKAKSKAQAMNKGFTRRKETVKEGLPNLVVTSTTSLSNE